MSSSGFTFTRVREEMIENLLEMGIKDFRVLDAMSQIPRHIFIDEALRSRAYENRSLTIGYQQTISQPYIVAKMTELMISHTGGRGYIFKNILELGSGCGYQSAVLSYFSEEVHAIERIKPLVAKSRENLNTLKIFNVITKHGDGYQDWDPKIKYEGIICAAAPRAFPEDLLKCCAENTKIVMPVGSSQEQKLLVVTKTKEGSEEEYHDDVAFVPMLPGKVDGNNL
ncbi:MAG: protein-L-isoaspartate(D-aspartate) O-methyltransferase [SAR86 cluster bacterium]|uniref:Protein-L-isoaspartate O-methyltransferase n=1 Tax=SAR86 cluster bacterium TaxID=2030880 RepID=A0A520MCB0_9GAMM|nr:MAG: protein-L-isoaspartate(D-aspartate) O-methyltransferase [SAR86 cluster bacterium]